MQKLLNHYNVIWNTPSRNSSGSMPLGNGDIGLNVWVEESGDLLFYLSKTDAWSEIGRLLKLGRVRVRLEPNPLTTSTPFRQELKLREGEIEIVIGEDKEQVVLRLWVDANAPVVHLETQSKQPLQMRATLEIWRAQPRRIEGTEANSAYGMMKAPHPVMESADEVLPAQENRVAWMHRNETSIWPETLQVQGLGDWMEKADDPLLHRTFGGLMRGEGLVAAHGSTLVSEQPQTGFHLTVFPFTAQTSSTQQWLRLLEEQIARVGSTPVEAARTAHRQWWKEFWERSYIFASGDAEAEIVTRGYTLQRFINACGGRGEFPIKFNGSIFTVDSDQPDYPFDADYRLWGGPYWFQNTRLTYWAMLAAGDTDLMRPFFQMYRDALPLALERTRRYFGHGGAFFAETMYFWGAFANDNYGWDRQDKHCSHIDNLYIRYYFQGGLELCAMMSAFYAHTRDEEFLQSTLLPIAEAVLQFYDEHYPRDDAGQLHIAPASSLEMWREIENPMPEIAGLQHVLDELLRLPEGVLTATQRDGWQRLRTELPPLPRREVEGTPVLAAATELRGETHNMENPELYAVFPYRQFGVAQPELEVARETFRHRLIQRSGGWHQDAVQAALLGLVDEARRDVAANFSTSHEGSRFPAFWGPNYDWVPDQDHGNVAALALQAMLMQTADDKIHLLPAWPQEWNCEFKLHAPHRTTVQGSYRDGEFVELTVTPPERKRDMEKT